MAKIEAVCMKVDPESIPNGRHIGQWGGYVVEFSAGGNHYKGWTDVGIRTPRAICDVVVSNGDIRVEVVDDD